MSTVRAEPLVLYAGPRAEWEAYAPLLEQACARRGVAPRIVDHTDTPERVDYIVYAPDGPLSDFTPFRNAKAVLSLWAGVEKILGEATLTQPLCRMVDAGLKEGMREWVAGHVLRHHLGSDAHVGAQDGIWRNTRVPPLARQRTVGMLGLGALGSASGQTLRQIGFHVIGWSRREKSVEGIDCHAGEDGLNAVLGRADILVLLLPLTPRTTHLINADSLARCKPGAVLINPGRGALIDDEALLAALDGGRISHATLDVFTREPLPADHPYWAHPRVTVTPHIASATRPESAAELIAENIARGESGAPFLHLVDRTAGY